MNNPCINCGRQRIDGKSWKQKVGVSVVTYTLTICPDPICQALVEKAIADRKEKSELLIRKKLEAKLERERLSATT